MSLYHMLVREIIYAILWIIYVIYGIVLDHRSINLLYRLFSHHNLNFIHFQESWVAPLYTVMPEEIPIHNSMMGYPIHPLLQVGSVSFPQKDYI
jgi:hypothetical protein